MSKAVITESSLTGIANAIRAKLGVQTTYKPGQMAAAIQTIPDPPVLVSKSINANGTYDPQDDDADGYSGVTVNVPGLTVEALSVTQNGTYTAPTGKAYSPVTVNVSGVSGVTFSTSTPTSAEGSDGDYWYVYQQGTDAFSFTANKLANAGITGGNRFTTSKQFTISALSIYGRSGVTTGEVHLSTDSGTELAAVSNIPITAGQWNTKDLTQNVTIEAGTYLLWGCFDTLAMTYKDNGSNPVNGITYNNAKYTSSRSTLPDIYEGSTVYGVNMVLYGEDKIVTDQYRKKSGSWEQLAL